MAYYLGETLRYVESWSQQLHTKVGLPVIVNNNTRFGAVSKRFLQVSFLSLSPPEISKTETR